MLVAGGALASGPFTSTPLSSAELFDPLTGLWTTTQSLDTRYLHTATLLPYGTVLLIGGSSDSSLTPIASAVQFDAGLAPISGPVVHSVRQTVLSSVSAVITAGIAFTVTSSGSSANGSGAATSTGFKPRLEGSFGQSGSSSGNSPVLQVQRIDSEQMRFVPNSPGINMTDLSVVGAAGALVDFPPGPIRVRVWVNGVPGASLSTLLRSDRIFADGFEAH